MSYHADLWCPLCGVLLDESQSVRVACRNHAQKKWEQIFKCEEGWLQNVWSRCETAHSDVGGRDRRGKCLDGPSDWLMAQHIGCERKNPLAGGAKASTISAPVHAAASSSDDLADITQKARAKSTATTSTADEDNESINPVAASMGVSAGAPPSQPPAATLPPADQGSAGGGKAIRDGLYDKDHDEVRWTARGKEWTFRHWQARTMNDLMALSGEMWFPLLLLFATATSRRCHRLALVGSTGSGKTVLAMQSMNKPGYKNGDIGNAAVNVDVEGYVYSPSSDAMLWNLALASRLEEASPEELEFIGTLRDPGDVKAAFFKAPNAEAGEAIEDGGGVRLSGGAHLKKSFWKDFKAAFKGQTGMGESKSQAVTGGEQDRGWHVLMWQDTAGEAASGAQVPLDFVRDRETDGAVLLLDACEVFRQGKDKTTGALAFRGLQTVSQWLNELRSRGRPLPCAVAMTKLDEVMEHLSAEDQASVRRLATDMSMNPADAHKEARTMLLRWLAENQSAAGISGQFVFQNGELINNLRRHKPPVLFIWTDGLRRARPSLLDKAYGTPEDAGESQPAVTSGLGKLVCWCLNEPWQSINRAASTAHDAPGV